MTDIPRDPSFYHPTTHAKQQARDRHIDWKHVSTTLEKGDAHRAEKEDCKLFLHDCYYPYPVGVVANIKDGAIVTVEYRYANLPGEEPDKDELTGPYRW